MRPQQCQFASSTNRNGRQHHGSGDRTFKYFFSFCYLHGIKCVHNALFKAMLLRGYWTPKLQLACFLCYIKIINTLKIKCILKQIVQGNQKWHGNAVVGQVDFKEGIGQVTSANTKTFQLILPMCFYCAFCEQHQSSVSHTLLYCVLKYTLKN